MDCTKNMTGEYISTSINDTVPEHTSKLFINFKDPIPKDYIPRTVKHIILVDYNQYLDYDSLPYPVYYLDVGDCFDLNENGGDLQDITVFKIGTEITRTFRRNNNLPKNVQDLYLTNYSGDIVSGCLDCADGNKLKYLELGLLSLERSMSSKKVVNYSVYLENIKKSVNNIPKSVETLKFRVLIDKNQDINGDLERSLVDGVVNWIKITLPNIKTLGIRVQRING